jgi:hypothetical protein
MFQLASHTTEVTASFPDAPWASHTLSLCTTNCTTFPFSVKYGICFSTISPTVAPRTSDTTATWLAGRIRQEEEPPLSTHPSRSQVVAPPYYALGTHGKLPRLAQLCFHCCGVAGKNLWTSQFLSKARPPPAASTFWDDHQASPSPSIRHNCLARSDQICSHNVKR